MRDTVKGKRPKPRNPAAKALADPLFRPKRKESKKAYKRKSKHDKGDTHDELRSN